MLGDDLLKSIGYGLRNIARVAEVTKPEQLRKLIQMGRERLLQDRN